MCVGLSAVDMSSSFCAISTAMTLVRMDLLGTSHGNDGNGGKVELVKKNFTMRETGKFKWVTFYPLC